MQTSGHLRLTITQSPKTRKLNLIHNGLINYIIVDMLSCIYPDNTSTSISCRFMHKILRNSKNKKNFCQNLKVKNQHILTFSQKC